MELDIKDKDVNTQHGMYSVQIVLEILESNEPEISSRCIHQGDGSICVYEVQCPVSLLEAVPPFGQYASSVDTTHDTLLYSKKEVI